MAPLTDRLSSVAAISSNLSGPLGQPPLLHNRALDWTASTCFSALTSISIGPCGLCRGCAVIHPEQAGSARFLWRLLQGRPRQPFRLHCKSISCRPGPPDFTLERPVTLQYLIVSDRNRKSRRGRQWRLGWCRYASRLPFQVFSPIDGTWSQAKHQLPLVESSYSPASGGRLKR